MDIHYIYPFPLPTLIGTGEMRQMNMSDDDIVQYAIEQYLMEEGTETDEVTLWEALRAQQPDIDQDLQRYVYRHIRRNRNYLKKNWPNN